MAEAGRPTSDPRLGPRPRQGRVEGSVGLERIEYPREFTLLQPRVSRGRADGLQLGCVRVLRHAVRDGVRVVVVFTRNLTDHIHHRREGEVCILRLGLHLQDGHVPGAVEGVELPTGIGPREAGECLLNGGAGGVGLLEKHQVLAAGDDALDEHRRRAFRIAGTTRLACAVFLDPLLVLERDIGALLSAADATALRRLWGNEVRALHLEHLEP
mmetsp:Transcript_26405/g.85295  ORF Transcript_26405/g.85295 Transcript_26405/m.85295 type:complete len:213 (+) Transcript_26405:323-961(+)